MSQSQEMRFQQKLTPYLKELCSRSDAMRKMYVYNDKYENIPVDLDRDILVEKEKTPVKGVVHKFKNRVLFLISYTCFANCRFCERQDRVGVGLDAQGRLNTDQIDGGIEYIRTNSNINEVIFSGGDPLTNPLGLLHAVDALKRIEHVKVIRIHTKAPLQMPNKVNFDVLQQVIESNKTTYLSIHVNHPDELNEITIPLVKNIRSLGYILLSQSVFLKGVNDDEDVLFELFDTLSSIGVRPYYIYHCQSIPTTDRFVMDLNEERRIMTVLRERLSGIAFPNHVIDIQKTTGKVIVPTNHWIGEKNSIRDYDEKEIDLVKYK